MAYLDTPLNNLLSVLRNIAQSSSLIPRLSSPIFIWGRYLRLSYTRKAWVRGILVGLAILYLMHIVGLAVSLHYRTIAILTLVIKGAPRAQNDPSSMFRRSSLILAKTNNSKVKQSQ